MLPQEKARPIAWPRLSSSGSDEKPIRRTFSSSSVETSHSMFRKMIYFPVPYFIQAKITDPARPIRDRDSSIGPKIAFVIYYQLQVYIE